MRNIGTFATPTLLARLTPSAGLGFGPAGVLERLPLNICSASFCAFCFSRSRSPPISIFYDTRVFARVSYSLSACPPATLLCHSRSPW